MNEFGKVGIEMSYFQSQMLSDYDSAESITDSDVEDGEQRKMLASLQYMQSREDCGSSRIPTAPRKLAAMIQERGASAKHTQAGHSRRESLTSSSSSGTESNGETCCNVFVRKWGTGKSTQEFSFQKNADPSNLGRSLLEGSKDHLRSQARSELMKQEHQVGSLNDCISELQQQAYAQGLELQDAQHGNIESRREQVRL